MIETESDIPVVKHSSQPDSTTGIFSRMLAGTAIEDHFADVILPTLAAAFNKQNAEVLELVDSSLKAKLSGDLQSLTAPIITKLVEAKFTEELRQAIAPNLQELVREILAANEGSRHFVAEIYNAATETREILGRQHYLFPILLRLMCVLDRNKNPLNVALVGPAGNGKTSMAMNCADALQLEAVIQPFNPQTTKSDLLGYMAANGNFVPSPFYDAFTRGKVFIADEFDAANPAIAITLNAAVANRRITFPNLETVRAHPKFRVLFIMNTAGGGADYQYTGRTRQDAATLDRMVYLQVPIDRGLEAAMAEIQILGDTADISEGGHFSSNSEVLDAILKVRAAVESHNLKYIISPRAVLHATAMHGAGFGKRWIMDCCVWRGMSEVDRNVLRK